MRRGVSRLAVCDTASARVGPRRPRSRQPQMAGFWLAGPSAQRAVLAGSQPAGWLATQALSFRALHPQPQPAVRKMCMPGFCCGAAHSVARAARACQCTQASAVRHTGMTRCGSAPRLSCRI